MFWKPPEQYQYSTVSELLGSRGEVTIRLFDLPIHHSPSDHMNYLVDISIGPFIVEEIFQTRVQFAAVRGFRRHSYHCFNCSKEMDITGKKPQMFEFTLTYKKFTPFTVKLTIPAVICIHCGLLNGVLTKDQDIEVVEATQNALTSKGLQIRKPSKE